jgi:sulfhydrogenase subunit delta
MTRPTLAVWKLASCDGCQLTLLDCEDELLQVAGAVDIAWFLEAGPARAEDRYDLSLVEGSVTTPADVERVRHIRTVSRRLVTIGACATAGGIQALRNFADVGDFLRAVYAHPHYISTLADSTPVVDHVRVDFELRGCPVDKAQLLEVLSAFLNERVPNVSAHSVCLECKERGTTCIMVAHGTGCLGPVTHAGCGAICPAYGRGCYGCFGPMEQPNPTALGRALEAGGTDRRTIGLLFRTFHAASAPFAAAAARQLDEVAP